jgi:hypothetical protein
MSNNCHTTVTYKKTPENSGVLCIFIPLVNIKNLYNIISHYFNNNSFSFSLLVSKSIIVDLPIKLEYCSISFFTIV